MFNIYYYSFIVKTPNLSRGLRLGGPASHLRRHEAPKDKHTYNTIQYKNFCLAWMLFGITTGFRLQASDADYDPCWATTTVTVTAKHERDRDCCTTMWLFASVQ